MHSKATKRRDSPSSGREPSHAERSGAEVRPHQLWSQRERLLAAGRCIPIRTRVGQGKRVQNWGLGPPLQRCSASPSLVRTILPGEPALGFPVSVPRAWLHILLLGSGRGPWTVLGPLGAE